MGPSGRHPVCRVGGRRCHRHHGRRELPRHRRVVGRRAPAIQPGYIAAYDALDQVSGGIFSVSWAALGFFGILFAAALWRSDEFSNLLAGISAASGVAMVGAVVIGVVAQVPGAFLLLILGCCCPTSPSRRPPSGPGGWQGRMRTVQFPPSSRSAESTTAVAGTRASTSQPPVMSI